VNTSADPVEESTEREHDESVPWDDEDPDDEDEDDAELFDDEDDDEDEE
jgi:hypothetical protein